MATLKRLRRSQRNRRAISLSKQKAVRSGPLTISAAVFDTPDIILTLAEPCVLNGIPQFLTDTGKLPTAAVRDTPTQVTLTYATPGSVTYFTVPDHDPALRSFSGGFCPPGKVDTSAP